MDNAGACAAVIIGRLFLDRRHLGAHWGGLSDEGENDGNPKEDADKAERCNSLSPARSFPTRNPGISKNSAHDDPPRVAHCPRS